MHSTASVFGWAFFLVLSTFSGLCACPGSAKPLVSFCFFSVLRSILLILNINKKIMNQKEVIKANTLIAKFMGLRSFVKNSHVWIDYLGDPFKPAVERAIYNSSWDWLMPVKDKIESIRNDEYGWFAVNIRSNTCSIDSKYLQESITGKDVKAYMSDPNAVFHTCIESTWYNIVQFIQWYNKQAELTAHPAEK